MKKLLLSSAAMMLAFSFSAIAGVPENNKSEAKAKTEAKESHTYRFVSQDVNGLITFEEGTNNNCPPGGNKPCEWISDEPMDTDTPLLQGEIESQATVTKRRS